MLNDIERKLLRILFNFISIRRRMPTMPELKIKTGRKQEDIYAGLRGLVEQKHILWPDNPMLETIVILQPWEPENSTSTKRTSISSNIDYWSRH
ncbi:hypothetical protein D3C76_1401180 [compost metagenome]